MWLFNPRLSVVAWHELNFVLFGVSVTAGAVGVGGGANRQAVVVWLLVNEEL